jgi:pilus biogenesis lipoprotein CpaD
MQSNPAYVAKLYLSVALRSLVLASAAAILAGCYTAQGVSLDEIPNDYRQRHPIVIKEGPRAVELFIGNRRGTLTGAQRADVLAFAQAWRRESTGGILIDVPAGTANAGAASAALQEVRSIFAAAGVPPEAVATRPSHSVDQRRLATLRLHYPRRPTIGSTSRTVSTTISAAPISAIWQQWSTIRRIWCSRAATPRATPAGALPSSTSTTAAKPRPRSTPMRARARSAISANDDQRSYRHPADAIRC